MGLSASQGRMLLLTARRSDLEFRAQQISQKRLILSQQLEDISLDYEEKTSDRQMKISLYNGATGTDGNPVQEKVNLTYAALTSGLSALDSAASGIRYQGNGSAKTNCAYRMVDGSGNIVVASKAEVPSAVKSKSTSPSVRDTTSGTGVGRNYNVVSQKDGEKIIANYYKPTAGTDLDKALNNSQATAKFDPATGAILVEIDGKEEYYWAGDGKKYTDTTKFPNRDKEGSPNETPNFTVTNLTILPSSATIPTSSNSAEAPVEQSWNGNRCSLMLNGSVYQTYIVDPALATGASDSNGNISGPNYLQDCIRNGKYLIQQTSEKDMDKNGNYSWHNVSWDSTTDISDSYYTENDAAAEAKYKRLQQQIQSQDKKLELELDNIETQRSAVTTEIESVQKVIDDNIESTFKTFA